MEEIPGSKPKFQPGVSKKKAEEIINFLTQKSSEIEARHLFMFFVDECHILGDDGCGCVWGRTNIRIEIPIKNTKDKQTYLGALDYQTKEFIVRVYPTGNLESMVEFIKYLQKQYPGQKIALIWDGASYHELDEVKDFLVHITKFCRRCLATDKEFFQKVLVSWQIFFYR